MFPLTVSKWYRITASAEIIVLVLILADIGWQKISLTRLILLAIVGCITLSDGWKHFKNRDLIYAHEDTIRILSLIEDDVQYFDRDRGETLLLRNENLVRGVAGRISIFPIDLISQNSGRQYPEAQTVGVDEYSVMTSYPKIALLTRVARIRPPRESDGIEFDYIKPGKSETKTQVKGVFRGRTTLDADEVIVLNRRLRTIIQLA